MKCKITFQWCITLKNFFLWSLFPHPLTLFFSHSMLLSLCVPYFWCFVICVPMTIFSTFPLCLNQVYGNISNYLLFPHVLYCYTLTLYIWWLLSNNIWKYLSSILKPKQVFCVWSFWKLSTQRVMKVGKNMYHIQCKMCVCYRLDLINPCCIFLPFLGRRRREAF